MTKQTLRKSLLSLSLVVPFALLGACSGKMSKSDCEKADFYEIGLKDGRKGNSAERLEEIKGMCGEHGVTVAEPRYTYGRQVGLAEYCDADRAEDDAKDGKTDSICLKEKVPPYETAYLKEIQKRREAKAEDLAKLQKSKDELSKKEAELQSQLNQIDEQNGAAAPVQQ